MLRIRFVRYFFTAESYLSFFGNIYLNAIGNVYDVYIMHLRAFVKEARGCNNRVKPSANKPPCIIGTQRAYEII